MCYNVNIKLYFFDTFPVFQFHTSRQLSYEDNKEHFNSFHSKAANFKNLFDHISIASFPKFPSNHLFEPLHTHVRISVLVCLFNFDRFRTVVAFSCQVQKVYFVHYFCYQRIFRDGQNPVFILIIIPYIHNLERFNFD